jgi:Domain of unknown function (DUF1905)
VPTKAPAELGSYEFEAEIWLSESVGSWAFVTVPPDLSDDIRYSSGPPAGFGSVRVEVIVGSTTWRTSVFPDTKSGCFVLPFKQAVRREEDLDIGDVARLSLSLVDT